MLSTRSSRALSLAEVSLILMLMLLGLSGVGCSPRIVMQYEPILIVPADDKLIDCPISKPPSPQALKDMPNDGVRFQAVSNSLMLQTKNLGECNIRWEALRTYKKEQIAEIEKKKKKD